MDLDIRAGVTAIVVMLIALALFIFFRAISQFKEAGNLKYFAKRKEKQHAAFRILLFAIILLIFALFFNSGIEPLIYRVYEPSPTATLTPTITLTPTVTLTPTPTTVPSATPVPLFSPTPVLSIIISSQFTSETTPNPDALFSPLIFAKNLDENYQPIEPAEEFAAPVDVMYAAFSYDGMLRGVQWTALWFREGELICMESMPWNGGSGGYGYSECQQDADKWQPGNYSVQMFVGETWKQTGIFRIAGNSGVETPEP